MAPCATSNNNYAHQDTLEAQHKPYQRTRCALWFYFVRSGWIHLPGVSGSTFRVAGTNGGEWSSYLASTRSDGTTIPSGYHFGFTTSVVAPSGGPDYRYYGFPLRCLSTVLDM